jgi:hypothetical protein
VVAVAQHGGALGREQGAIAEDQRNHRVTGEPQLGHLDALSLEPFGTSRVSMVAPRSSSGACSMSSSRVWVGSAHANGSHEHANIRIDPERRVPMLRERLPSLRCQPKPPAPDHDGCILPQEKWCLPRLASRLPPVSTADQPLLLDEPALGVDPRDERERGAVTVPVGTGVASPGTGRSEAGRSPRSLAWLWRVGYP